MKRSSCLSALLVSLSLTATSAAFAAPDEAALQRDPAPSDAALQQQGGTAPATGAAPAAGGAQPAQPAVSVGTSSTSTTSDSPSTSPPEPVAKPKQRPFAGSSFYIQNSMTTGTVFKGQQLDYNPTVESAFWFLPRFALNDAFQLRGRVIVNYEYTDSDSTVYRNEPVLSDTSLQLFYRKLPKLPLGIIPNIALNAGFPTSKASRARTLIFSPGATLQLARPVEKLFLGGDAMFLASVVYSHPIYSSRNPEVSDPLPYKLQCMGGTGCGDMITGTLNPSDTLAYTFLFSMEWGNWNPAIYYLGASQWVYSPKEVTDPVSGQPVGRPENFEPSTVRQTHYLSAWLDYNFNAWFTAEVGIWNSITALGADGQRANIIFDRYQDTRVYLGGSFQLDNLVKAIQGGSEGEAGVVRAKNTKQPMWQF